MPLNQGYKKYVSKGNCYDNGDEEFPRYYEIRIPQPKKI